MKHIKEYNDFLNEAKEDETTKKKLIDFVEKKGKATWKEIHSELLKMKGLDPNDKSNRGYGSGYFSASTGTWNYDSNNKMRALRGRDHKTHGPLMVPTKKDPRYLEKDGKYYIVKVWDKKTKI